MPEQAFVIQDLRGGYIDLVNWVLQQGEVVSPRGQETREIGSALVKLENPIDALPIGINRGVSLGIASVEACQLLSGLSTPKLVIGIGPVFKNYAEDNGEFHGAYGPRTNGQYAKMVERLKADPDTRQAVTTIWDKNYDLLDDKRDYPCTLTHTFHVRKNRLVMRTHMRSNDVIKGVGYDYFQFTRVQLAIASILGIEPGPYYHYADSLHLYSSDLRLAQRLQLPIKDDPELAPYFTGECWDDVASKATDALEYANTFMDTGMASRPSDSVSASYGDRMIEALSKNTDRAVNNE